MSGQVVEREWSSDCLLPTQAQKSFSELDRSGCRVQTLALHSLGCDLGQVP